jgi:hypothetical protein
MTQYQINARRYEWFRKAFVAFDDDDVCNVAMDPLSLCYTPEEVDEEIDAELAKAAG